MKNTRFLFFLLATAIFYSSCRPDTASTTGLTNNGLRLLTTATPAWTYRNMRVYPIVAETAALNGQEGLQHLTTLSEAMTTPGFRITEKKQFGRDEGPWYSALTVQNKTQDTVYLMSGEVVTGGNQDRVLAHDDVILPASLKNVEVFCVERGRSHYYDASAPIAVRNEAAFKSYFSVASPRVRQAVQRTNQNEVWAAVDSVTAANNAGSDTHTYAALATANDQKAVRDAYLQHFAGQFADLPNMVGIVVVCGDQVLGVDIFGHPDLFKRQFAGLLHGYVVEAGAGKPQAGDDMASAAFTKIARLAAPGATSTEKAGRYSRNGAWVHLYSK